NHVRIVEATSIQAYRLWKFPETPRHSQVAGPVADRHCVGRRGAALPAEELWPHPSDGRAVRTTALRSEQRQHGQAAAAVPAESAEPGTERRADPHSDPGYRAAAASRGNRPPEFRSGAVRRN